MQRSHQFRCRFQPSFSPNIGLDRWGCNVCMPTSIENADVAACPLPSFASSTSPLGGKLVRVPSADGNPSSS
jgi:hypothetical protein